MTDQVVHPELSTTICDRLYIGGEWTRPHGDRRIESVSPIDGSVIGSVPEGDEVDVDAAVTAAGRAFRDPVWRDMSGADRAALILQLRNEIEKRLEPMDNAFTAEIGIPKGAGRGFHQVALTCLEESARLARTFDFEEERVAHGGQQLRVVREPVGVVGAIIAWNGPITNACLKLAPVLAIGCTVVLKPAPEGLLNTILLAEAIEATDIPPGVINIVPAGVSASEHLVAHPDVDKVAFTGSSQVGRRIMELCSARVRNVTLELGGKSAAVIVDDVDLRETVPLLLSGGLTHSGQVCAALTRIIVPRDRQEELLREIERHMADWVVGDPFDPESTLGPLVAERQRTRVEEYIKSGTEEGARLVLGGGRPAGLDRGWYVEPTVFADVRSDMRIAREEIFGPVLCVLPFDSIDEAICLANDTDYGLSGAVYGRDERLAEHVARRMRTGQVSVNTWNICLTEPFGGYKQSGLGREGGVEGLAPYLETKLVQTRSDDCG